MASIISKSEEETKALGHRLGEKLPPGSIVCFFGDLAAGKTTFIKGLAKGAAGIAEEAVNSPTFVYLNVYEGTQNIYHFDLYRLTDQRQFLALGFDEMLFAKGISCIEWSERISSLLPSNCIRVKMDHYNINTRQIEIYGEISV